MKWKAIVMMQEAKKRENEFEYINTIHNSNY